MRRRVSDVRALIERVFRANRASESEAELLADVLIEAELRGRPTHGVNRVEGLVRWLRGRGAGTPEVVEERGPLVRINGRDQSGYLTAAMMADHAARVAMAHGHALVGACNTRHCGMLGYYATRAAQQGVIALMFADCSPMVAPWGGTEKVLGTNPLAAAFPAEPRPILIDMGTSATTYGAIDCARRAGDNLPRGVALDSEGRVTTRPDAVHVILPFAEHKGYALGLLVQLLSGVVVGADAVPEEHRDYGLLMLAMRPDLFAPKEHYDEGVARLIRRLKSVRPMTGCAEVLIPGERAFKEREQRLREGIDVSEEQWAAIGALGAGAQ